VKRAPQKVGFPLALSISRVVCPRCGLGVDVTDLGHQLEFRYDLLVWEKWCRSPVLGGASACLALTDVAPDGDLLARR
jgi:hypothetical protein